MVSSLAAGLSEAQSPNFSFLAKHDDLLLRHAALAEAFVFLDANAALVKLRQLAETLAKGVAAKVGLPCGPEEHFADVERSLFDRGLLDRALRQVMRSVRLAGNSAVHSLDGNRRDALHHLKLVRQIAVWFHKTTKDRHFKAPPFVPPPNPQDVDQGLEDELQQLRESLAQRQAELEGIQLEADDLRQRVESEAARAADAYKNEQAALQIAEQSEADRVRAEAELQQLREEYEAKLAEASKAQKSAPQVEKETIVEVSRRAADEMDLDEFDTRKLIDEQLRDAGWEADTTELKHSRGVRPEAGRNLAIAEWPTADGGYSDYVLFVGLMPIASIEAKRRRRSARSALGQAERYAKHFAFDTNHQSPGGPWGEYSLPFAFATNGTPYLRQLIDESGVWFRDTRSNTHHARPLVSWYTPKGLKKLLAMNIETADAQLATATSDYLPLRPYQKAAISSVEGALKDGQRQILLAMATGTGKTRTCICLIYRLMKAQRFKRVLFVVDRTSLGEQAAASFLELKLENNQSFSGIYDVKELGDLEPDENTRLQVATIQAMVKRIKSAEEDANPIPIDSYDCIIVDECHRGYVQDRDMSDLEMSYRDQDDFISTYVRVLDYFDAVRVGLTATPALHTRNIFGPPVFTYSIQQAVLDGHLVDQSPPYLIKTELNQQGVTWEPGEDIQVFNTFEKTVHTDTTEDQINIEIDGFNKKAMVESFSKVVCEVLAEHLPPGRPGKTLIFCVRDTHADTVERLLTDALEARYGPVDHRLVQKITGEVDKPSESILHFKKEQMPKYVVTVDLLTTGIDVPEITNIVFIRRTNSRILYDQMIGRATRLCPNMYGEGLDKDCFNIFDAVGQYPAMQRYTDMRPVAVSPRTPLSKLIAFLRTEEDEEVLADVHRQIVAKLRRKASTIEKKWLEDFMALAGDRPKVVTDSLRDMSPLEARDWFNGRDDLVTALDKIRPGSEVYISTEEDKLIEVVREDPAEYAAPEDYLQAFERYLREHAEELPAIDLVTTRPRELTRQSLKELRAKLQVAGFSVEQLAGSAKGDTSQTIAASIIDYIRHVMLDEPLLPLEQRVDAAIKEVSAAQEWSGEQRRWLELIGKQLKTEVLLDAEAFEQGQFKREGGFKRLNKVFDGKLEDVLRRIVDRMWQQAP